MSGYCCDTFHNKLRNDFFQGGYSDNQAGYIRIFNQLLQITQALKVYQVHVVFFGLLTIMTVFISMACEWHFKYKAIQF